MSRSRQKPPWAIRAFSYDYPSGHRVELHSHEEHQLVFAAAGVMTVQTPEGSWIVPPNRAVWVPAGVEHSIRMSGAVSMRTLYLPRPLGARGLPERCAVLEVSPLVRELVLAAVARGGLDVGRSREDANLFRVLLDSLRTLPVRAMHLPFPRDHRALRIANRLERQPGDMRAARDLVRGSGASPRTIERLFRSETGVSFGAWRHQLRLGRALELLARGESVTAVAIESGYAGTSAFVSAFKASFGRTPGRYFH
jgi:AraC-like DNA-binding protein